MIYWVCKSDTGYCLKGLTYLGKGCGLPQKDQKENCNKRSTKEFVKSQSQHKHGVKPVKSIDFPTNYVFEYGTCGKQSSNNFSTLNSFQGHYKLHFSSVLVIIAWYLWIICTSVFYSLVLKH